MGTTTFYLKHNDIGQSLKNMSKEDLDKVSALSPHSENNSYAGWTIPFELHNGNVYILVFWKGRLMRLEDAPHLLNKKYYDKYKGRVCKEYEWTLLKKMILNEIAHFDKQFKKQRRRRKVLVK